MTKRVVSGIVAIAYVVLGYNGGGAVWAFRCTMFLLLPLACIWFSEEMGSFTGVMRGQNIDTQTPGCFVAFGGWVLLSLPLIFFLIAHD